MVEIIEKQEYGKHIRILIKAEDAYNSAYWIESQGNRLINIVLVTSENKKIAYSLNDIKGYNLNEFELAVINYSEPLIETVTFDFE